MFNQDKEVHSNHCCPVHGCKYNELSCPVFNSKISSKYNCLDCQTYTHESTSMPIKMKLFSVDLPNVKNNYLKRRIYCMAYTIENALVLFKEKLEKSEYQDYKNIVELSDIDLLDEGLNIEYVFDDLFIC